jgi:hypothetical protein
MRGAQLVELLGRLATAGMTLVVSRWEFVGLGYLSAGDAALALSA